MKEIKVKHWITAVCSILGILFAGMALLTFLVDPYFHYHKPLKGLKYRLYEERYINDGIGKHFDYNGIITGNSLTENFKTSEFDELFSVNSVKLPYSGAGYREIWESLNRALKKHPGTETVVAALDYDDLIREKDWIRYEDYPEYLYDDNLWNDVSYLWNKDVFYRGTLYNLLMTFRQTDSTTFDEYASWNNETGAAKVMSLVDHIEDPKDIDKKEYAAEDKIRVAQNVESNIVSVVKENPDTQFYLYFAPSSIAQWCIWNNRGETIYRTEAEKTAAEILLACENVHLYCFFERYDWICNLDNYSDTIHYTAEINSDILRCMKEGEYLLTKDNYQKHIEETQAFYSSYDYMSLLEEQERGKTEYVN